MITQEEIKKELEEFNTNVYYPKVNIPEDIDTLLSLKRSELAKRSKEDLSFDSIMLAQYACYLQLSKNRIRANLTWCQGNIDSIIGREINNVNGYGFKEKSLVIIRSDKEAREFENLRIKLQVKYDMLDSLEQKVEGIGRAIHNATFNK